LRYCGTKSGKDVDKIKETGLIPVETDKGNIFFQQASLVIECKKNISKILTLKSFYYQKFKTAIH